MRERRTGVLTDVAALPVIPGALVEVPAGVVVRSELVAVATLTLVTSSCVETPPGWSAHLRPLLTLVDVLTVLIVANRSEPVRTGAQECSDQILTVELTLVGLRQTLVDILSRNLFTEGNITHPY